jgi:hypothetical protein
VNEEMPAGSFGDDDSPEAEAAANDPGSGAAGSGAAGSGAAGSGAGGSVAAGSGAGGRDAASADPVPSEGEVERAAGAEAGDVPPEVTRLAVAVADLDGLGELPVRQHVGRYDRVHAELSEALASIDEI